LLSIEGELLLLYEANDYNLNWKEKIMSKGQSSKKGSKKEPAKTMKEKKAAKREKKNEKLNQGILNQ
jgi:hypothetical protein